MKNFTSLLFFMATMFISLPVYSVSVWDGAAEMWTEGSGTESDPYQIQTAQNLAYLAQSVNDGTSYAGEYFVQTDDIDLNNIEWTPIGGAAYMFEASFNGGGHTISGLNVATMRKHNGLYGYTTAIIENLTVSGSVNAGIYTGGITAYSTGEIDNCNFEGDISVQNNLSNLGIVCVGGVVGYSTSSIVNCRYSGKIGQSSYGAELYIGGIVGYFTAASSTVTISHCSNFGTISCSNRVDGIGGIVGCFTAKTLIINCNNFGTITSSSGTYCIGGIVGFSSVVSSSATITECSNSGSISGGRYSGGIVGRTKSPIENCINTGTVSIMESGTLGDWYCGGVVGYTEGLIRSCINAGNIRVSGTGGSGGYSLVFNVGGIAGLSKTDKPISKCINTGNISASVSGSTFVGLSSAGIVGSAQCQIQRCYNVGNVSSLSNTGPSIHSSGIVAAGSSTVSFCYNRGNISAILNYYTNYLNNLDRLYAYGIANTDNAQNSYNAGYVIAGNAYGTGKGTGTNSYCLELCATMCEPTSFKTAEEMRSASFVDLLNGDGEAVFVMDTDNINDGYPIFAWQKGFDVIFKNDDGTVLQSENLLYGDMPVYKGQDPVKPSDAQFSYTFAGWQPELTEVTGEQTYTAQYNSTTNKYVVRFLNEDGTELQSEELEYGAVPVYTGATPTKDITAQYTYTFNGWDSEIGKVTGAKDYTATYSSATNKYLITFENYNGEELQSSEVEYGQTPSYTGAIPEKPADAEFTYTFSGWSPEVVAVVGAQTYTAQFSSTTNKYLVSFLNEDGTELQSEELEYGTIPVYSGEVPTKQSTAQYTYTFNGWDSEIETITAAKDYKATYTSTINSYVVRFLNEDGTELQSEELEYGAIPVYSGETPTKDATAQYTYTFNGWDSEIGEVTGAKDYNATYTSTINSYLVRFFNEDGTELQSEELEYGAIPVYAGEVPTKQSTAQYTYSFNGWNSEIGKVTGAKDYTATYSSTTNKYLITFENYNGDELQSREMDYGLTPTYTGATPIKPSDAEFTYTFAGWSPELTSVTSAQKYTAQFSSTTNKYLIRFLNSDGTILQSENLEYGSIPSYKGAVPTRPSTSQYVYTFSGWNNTIEPVERAADYMATYTSAVNKYEIWFVNYDGTELQRKEVSYGDTPIYTGAIPVKPSTAQYTYSFRGWDSEIVAVDESKTYTATYTGTVNKYTVTLSGINCDVTGDGVYNYGTVVELKATPNECTHFIGWSDGEEKEIRTITVTGDVTLTATAESNKYNVDAYSLDKEQGGVILSVENPVTCGMSVTIEAVPNDGYAFHSWSDGSTDNPRTIVVDRDYDISAQWNKITPVPTYEVRLIVYKDDTWGTVTGDGTYKEGATATLNAVPASGYKFSYWYDPNTQERIYENPLSFVVDKDVSLTASFSRLPKIKVTYGQRSAEAEGDAEDDVISYVVSTKQHVDIDNVGSRSILIYNTAGQIMLRQVNVEHYEGHLPSGVYIINIDGVMEKFIVR